jgi:glycosyltransferase involved in cell wall biosynthesis
MMGGMNRPLRVAMITGSYPPDLCGVADYTWHLTEALGNLGLEIDVYTISGGETGVGGNDRVHRRTTGWGWGELKGLVHHLSAKAPEVVHLQYQTALFGKGWAITLLPLLMRRAEMRTHLVVTLHDLNGPRVIPRIPATGRPAVRYLASRADGMVVTNELDLATISNWGIQRDRLRLMPVGPTIPVEPQAEGERDRLRESLGIGRNESLFVYFGLVMRDKGLRTLVEATVLLPRAGWRMLLIASPRDRREEEWRRGLQELAASLGMEDRIIWRERLPPGEVSRHLSASDIGVLPFEEGISTRRSTFAVMMAHGLPLVSTKPRKWPRIFATECPAMLVPPRHPLELARTMRILLERRSVRAEMSRRSWKMARNLSWRQTAADTEALYRTIRKGSGRLPLEIHDCGT